MTTSDTSASDTDTRGYAAQSNIDVASRLLRRIALFKDLDAEGLVAIARVLRPRYAPKGAVILAQDQPGSVAFIIVRGAVDVLLESEDGRQFIVAQLGPGDHFGEMSLLDTEPRSATVVANEDTHLLVMRREEFLAELMRHPQMMLHMLMSLSRRLRRADSQVASLAFGDTAARLARLLLTNARPSERGLSVAVAQEDLAAMVGATRQTVGRIFSSWRTQGLISTGRRRTAILDADALRAEARL